MADSKELLELLEIEKFDAEPELLVHILLSKFYINEQEMIMDSIKCLKENGLTDTFENQFFADVILLSEKYDTNEDVIADLRKTYTAHLEAEKSEYMQELSKTADIIDAAKFSSNDEIIEFLQKEFYQESLMSALKKLEIEKFGSWKDWLSKYNDIIFEVKQNKKITNSVDLNVRINLLLTKFETKKDLFAKLKKYYIAEMRPLWKDAIGNRKLNDEDKERILAANTKKHESEFGAENSFDALRKVESKEKNEKKFVFNKNMIKIIAVAATFLLMLTIGYLIYLNSGDDDSSPALYKNIEELTKQEIYSESELQSAVTSADSTAILINEGGFDFYKCFVYIDGDNVENSIAYEIEYRNSIGEKVVITVIFKENYTSYLEDVFDFGSIIESINEVNIAKRIYEQTNSSYVKFSYDNKKIYVNFDPHADALLLSVIESITN